MSESSPGSTRKLRDLPDDYDLDHLTGALEHLTDFRVAIDGGAHRGIWTREMAKRFEAVIAFEPRRYFSEQIVGAEEHIFVFPFALGANYGSCDIRDGDKNTGQAHVTKGLTYTMRPLDFYDFEHVDFLKLDLEGYELLALHGAAQTIETWHPAILVEQNGLSERYGYTDDDLAQWLGQHGYELTAEFGVDKLYCHEYRLGLQH